MNGYKVDFTSLRLQVEKPGRVLLRHPVTGQPLKDKDGTSSYVDIMSRDSADWQRRDREVVESRARRAADGLRLTPEDAAADLIETMARMTHAWYLVDLFGEPVAAPCNRDTAHALYSDPGLSWIRDQVAAGTGDRSLFMPARSGG